MIFCLFMEITKAEKTSALIVASIAAFLTPFMGSAVNVALPSLGDALGLDALSLNWVSTVYLLAAAIFLLPLGRLADILGRKMIFLYGIVGYTIASLLCSLSVSFWMLIIFRILQGIGGAMIYATGVAIISSVFSPGERGRALGINVSAVYMGLSLGPFLGGLLTHYLGWRSVFWINVPLGMFVIGLVLWKLKHESKEAQGETFDYFGSFVYALGLIALMYGFSQLPSNLGIVLVCVGVLGLVGFLFVESRQMHPLIEIKLFFHNRVFTFSNIAALINYSTTFGIVFLISLYLQYVKGLSPQIAGLVLVAQPVIMALVSPIAGRLSDTISPRAVASVGMGLSCVGLVFMYMLDSFSSLYSVVLGLVVVGLGFGLFSSPNMNAIMGSVSRKYFGVASATAATMRLVGQTFSMGVVLILFALFIGKAAISSSPLMFLSSMKIAFLIFAILCFFGIFASLARGKSSDA